MKKTNNPEPERESDLQTLQALESLRQIIKESINKANGVLEEAKKVEELKALLQQHQASCDALNAAQIRLKETEQQIEQKLSQLEDFNSGIDSQIQQATLQKDELYAAIEQSREALAEITNHDSLNELKQEIATARSGLQEAQIQLQQVNTKNQEQVRKIEQEVLRIDLFKVDIQSLVERGSSQVEQLIELRNRIDTQAQTIQELSSQVLSTIQEIGGEETLETLRQQQQSLINDLNQAQLREIEIQAQTEQSYEIFTTQLAKRTAELEQLSSQVNIDKNQILELVQQVEARAETVIKLQPVLEQIRQAIVSAVNEFGGKEGLAFIRQEYQTFRNTLNAANRNYQQINIEAEQKLQALQAEATRAETRLAVAQERVEEINNAIATASSELVRQAMSQIETVQQQIRLQEEAVVNQIRPLVETTLQQLGGEAGLQKLQQQLQEGRETLAQIQSDRQQFYSGVGAAIPTLQELLQTTVSRVEQMRSDVANLTQEVSSDKALIQNINVELENLNTNSARAAMAGFEQLQNQLLNTQADLKKQLVKLEERQQYLYKWLWGVSFGLGVVLVLAIAMLRFR